MTKQFNSLRILPLLDATQALKLGQILAYPTEAVFGLGCDPDNQNAVLALCALKQRPIEKGLILIASDFSQLLPYIDLNAITETQLTAVTQTWPGPYTWVMPSKLTTPKYLRGGFETIAVRVSNHPTVKALCGQFGKPIVSTSANLSGMAPAKTPKEVFEQFAGAVAISEGEIGTLDKPTIIRDARTGEIFRG